MLRVGSRRPIGATVGPRATRDENAGATRHGTIDVTWSEDRLHRWLREELAPRGLAGSVGHDAAVLKAAEGRTVACADQTIAGVHYEPGRSGARVARKAVGRALSDLAATAARPRAVLVAATLPPETEERWIRALLRAARDVAREHRAELVGGDLACAPGPAHVAVTALGVIEARGRPPGRDRARAGQIVVATGAFGGSRLGRHERPRPRIAEGRALWRAGATAMMDVSDGLARDLARIARASGVRIELIDVPVHRDAERAARASGRTAREHALSDGEDYELVATLPRSGLDALPRARDYAVVGHVATGRGLWIARPDGRLARWDGSGGWVHGR